MSKWAAGMFNVTVDLWKGKRTAGPSTPLRSGRDNPVGVGFGYRDQGVIPTAAQRSGGTCCSFSLPPMVEAIVDFLARFEKESSAEDPEPRARDFSGPVPVVQTRISPSGPLPGNR
jgi:hypothetical protein